MIDTIEKKITVFGIDRILQVMAITDDPTDWRTLVVRHLQGERVGSSREVANMEM